MRGVLQQRFVAIFEPVRLDVIALAHAEFHGPAGAAARVSTSGFGCVPSISRRELYGLVWSEAMWTVAPRLGLSDRGLKRFAGEQISLPRGIGYWAKRQAVRRLLAFAVVLYRSGAPDSNAAAKLR